MTFGNRAALWALSATVLLAAGQPAAAADKPVLLLTLSSVDELLGDFGYLAEAVGFPQAGQMGTMMASQYAEGLDTSRPIGFLVKSNGEEIKPIGMFPIKDLEAVLAGVEPQLGTAEDAGNGILELAGPAPIYVKEQGEWAYVVQSVDDLENLPSDPTKTLQGLNKSYDIAIRGFIQNLPNTYKEMALAQIKEGVEMQLAMLPSEDEADLQRQVIQNSIRQWEAIFEGLNEITLGWKVDDDNKKVLLDMSLKTVPGTKMARQMEAFQDSKSRFTGFVMKDAAITMNTTTKMLPEDIEQSLAMFDPASEKVDALIDGSDDIPDGETKDTLKRLAASLLKVARDTIATGEVDGGASVLFDEEGMAMIGGMRVADGSQVEATLKDLADSVPNQAGMPTIEMAADQHAGVRFHRISVPVPEEQTEARQALGENLIVTVGIAQESIYVAVGEKGMEHLRKAIDGSVSKGGKSALPFRLRIALGPIMKFAAQMEDSSDVVEAIAATLENADDDQILAVSKPIPNGATYRFEVREGVLKAIGQGVQAAQSGGVTAAP